jgi:bifunctional oligoribonuclease and PAP phosphatase NrnA
MDRTSMFTAASITWKERLGNANTIMLVTHVNPDGDAIGSLIGLMMALPQLTEARIIPVLQQPIPAYLNWVSGTEQSIALTADMHWPDPDLIIAVDCASADRIGGIAKPHLDRLEHATIIQIDHHATNTLFGVNNLIVPDSCATCEVITEFLPYLGLTLTAGIATPLLLGIMTDTQSFQIYDTSAKTLSLGASLFNAGADHAQIVAKVFRSTRLEALTLASRVINSMHTHGDVVWCGVPLDWVNEVNASDDESDEALHMLQRIEGPEVIMLVKQRTQGVKISLRSRNVNVATVARKFGGGGHIHAAGINFADETIDSAAALVLPDLLALCTDSSASTNQAG